MINRSVLKPWDVFAKPRGAALDLLLPIDRKQSIANLDQRFLTSSGWDAIQKGASGRPNLTS